MRKRLSVVLAALGLLLSQGAIASCNGLAQSHGHIQWSDPVSIVSPGERWQVEVHPDLTSDENNSKVLLRRCSDGRSSDLFTLERNAEIYWAPDGDHLLIINQPAADVSRLLFFDMKLPFDRTRPSLLSTLGDKLQKDIQQRLGASRHIDFYLLNFVSWNDKRLTLAVGGMTSSETDGPATPYCYGAVLDADGSGIEAIISGDDSPLKFHSGRCEYFP